MQAVQRHPGRAVSDVTAASPVFLSASTRNHSDRRCGPRHPPTPSRAAPTSLVDDERRAAVFEGGGSDRAPRNARRGRPREVDDSLGRTRGFGCGRQQPGFQCTEGRGRARSHGSRGMPATGHSMKRDLGSRSFDLDSEWIIPIAPTRRRSIESLS